MRNFRLDDESGHQEALFSWAAYRTEIMPELQYMYHVPNGGKRDKATAAVLKRQGVKAGVPDIMLPAARAGYHGLYIELKAGENTTTKKQNGGVYEMDLTRTAVNSFATHCSKLKPEIEGSALKSLEKTLQHKPNYFMDTTKFIKRLATYVAVEHTAFIIPIEDEYGRLCGWYPLRAQRCEVVEAAGQQARTYLGLDTVGVAEFFALLYIAYEVVSIFKNMALCGLPVKKVWEKVREFLAKYTDELPDTDELDGDSTTGNVEEHRTQER